MNKPDITRLKWIDPEDKSRFTKKPIKLLQSQDPDTLMDNMMLLLDSIFDRISVLNQTDETTARGAKGNPDRKIAVDEEIQHLLDAEVALWQAFNGLEKKKNKFVEQQIGNLLVDKDLKLHIGAAGYQINDWVNIDVGGGDIALNVNWGLPFEDNSVKFIYSSHMFEHLRYFDQAPFFVSEMYRVLRPKGVLRLVVPDIKKLFKAYIEKNKDYFSERQNYYPINKSFLQEGVGTLDYLLLYSGAGPQTLNFNHKFGYDFDSLAKMLYGGGFRNIITLDYMQSEHPDLRIDKHSEDAGVLGDNSHCSLFLEAEKP